MNASSRRVIARVSCNGKLRLNDESTLKNFGPTNAFRAAVLQSIGGFDAPAPHLADDFMLGNFIAKRGLRVVISKYVIHTMVSDSTLQILWEHEGEISDKECCS